ncbi:ABC transporter ATP-binding protein [uncultured Roseobacter sp.]|uniref:ABC transporter ATP-binding protein n=1 Tax=uncultured Roseobacter sp. TaxID=114847 RepID=UPI002637CFBC|nr:oligopeptide/dipeptide ABC transporter ATP-binding protein [uncultured Roseobacter sp.]
MTQDVILKVDGLSKVFESGGIRFIKDPYSVKAVQDVSFSLLRGETLGVVGESGCGKSTLARCVLNLIKPTTGMVSLDGNSLEYTSNKEWRRLRQRLQIIFQDPFSSLNPKLKIGRILAEPLKVHRRMSYRDALPALTELMQQVGLPETALDKYPHEFSGGQRQRIAIARALVLEPDIIVADEAVSALDVSIQAQILEMLGRLKKERNLSFLFITHDLGVVRNFCDRTLVMYLGRVVEAGPVDLLLDAPLHPYTKSLRDAAPIPDVSTRQDVALLEGEIPSPANPPSGCPFHPRCPSAIDICAFEFPETVQLEGRSYACHNPNN